MRMSCLRLSARYLDKLKACAAKKTLEKNKFVSLQTLGQLAIARYLREEARKDKKAESVKEAVNEQQ
jgi:hypothetical protein